MCASKRVPKKSARSGARPRVQSKAGRDVEQQMRAILEGLPNGALAADAETGRFVFANAMIGRMLRCRAEELLGLTPADIHPPEIAPRVIAQFEKALRGESEGLADVLLQRKDGSVFPVAASNVFLDLEGRHCLLSVFTDISGRKQAEEALLASDTILQTILSNVHDVIWSLSYPDFKPIFISASIETIYGHPRKAFFQNPQLWEELVHPEDRAMNDQGKQDLVEKGYAYRECRIVRPDGAIRWIGDRSKLAYDDHGSPIRVDGVVSDITERKRSEKQLTALVAVVEHSDDIIVVRDLDLRVVASNTAFAKISGHERARDLIGKTDAEIFNVPPETEPVRTYMEDERHAQRLWPGEFVLREETFGAVAGGVRHVLTKKYPIFDVHRKLIGTGHISTDITARKRTEETLRESELWLGSLLKSLPMPVFYKDIQGRYLGVNLAFETFFGKTRTEIVGRTVFDLNPVELAQIYQAKDTELFERPSPQVYGTQVRNAQGELRDVIFHKAPLTNGVGAVIGLIGIVHDITERKQAETYAEMGREALHILEQPQDFLSAIRQVLAVFKARTGLDAVGIRLQDGEDFPYFTQTGFSEEFLRTENSLVARDPAGAICRDKDGQACLECTCGLVLSGKTDPNHPLFTQGGSCWINDAGALLDLSAVEDPRYQPRNHCIHQGYVSLALVPIRDKDRIVGLIHLGDRRKNRFTLETIERLEVIAAHIGEVLMRKRAEEALKESHERFDQLAEQSRTFVWELDAAGVYTYVSPVVEKVLGYRPEELVGRLHFYDLLPEEGREEFKKMAFEIAQRTERFTDFRNPMMTKDGRLLWVSTNGIPLWDASGKLMGFRGSDTDITERKRMEEESSQMSVRLSQLTRHVQAAREEESRRIAVWLHDEVGQMLTRARMDAMLLEVVPGLREGEAVPILASLKRTLDDAVVTIRNISSDLRPAILDDFGLVAVLEWIIHENEKRLKIPFQLEVENVPDSLDPELSVAFYRMVRECLTNIARHAQATAVTLRLFADDHTLTLVVQDDGRGMKPGVVENPASFGLSQLRERAGALGGRVQFESQAGQGTTVRITAPLHPPQSAGGPA